MSIQHQRDRASQKTTYSRPPESTPQRRLGGRSGAVTCDPPAETLRIVQAVLLGAPRSRRVRWVPQYSFEVRRANQWLCSGARGWMSSHDHGTCASPLLVSRGHRPLRQHMFTEVPTDMVQRMVSRTLGMTASATPPWRDMRDGQFTDRPSARRDRRRLRW